MFIDNIVRITKIYSSLLYTHWMDNNNKIVISLWGVTRIRIPFFSHSYHIDFKYIENPQKKNPSSHRRAIYPSSLMWLIRLTTHFLVKCPSKVFKKFYARISHSMCAYLNLCTKIKRIFYSDADRKKRRWWDEKNHHPI